MKSIINFFSSVMGVGAILLLLAFVGILSQSGMATTITYVTVAPFIIFVVGMLYNAFKPK